MEEIAKAYIPGEVENEISEKWEVAEIGKAAPKSKKNVFTMMMPPANVTGALHLGHAITLTIEDVLARYQRMRGKDVLWLPGTDHAGIATQNVVEKRLLEKGLSRDDLGREMFVTKVWEWKDKYHARISEQIKKMGASCDWSREAFTLDEDRSAAVTKAFVQLYRKKLIYRDKKLVNWCPRCKTVLSDIEVEHREEEGNLYFIRYFVSATDRSICVATTRPETMLGDTAVAVNPNDPRYRDFVGKELILPIVNREISVIADERVDPKFGTGAVKITPAHDPLDAEIGRDHKLPSIVVIGPHGKMTKHAGRRFVGMPLNEARKAVVKYLDDIGNLEKIEKHTHSVGHCSRCDATIEPLESMQWFVKMKPLAAKALSLVKKKKLEFVPARFEKEFVRWLDEIRDWCVSRQLWWGHQLPVWYCKKVPEFADKRIRKKEGCQRIIVSEKPPKKCPSCKNLNITQDPDVLDTWFSSGLWPFATLGWPKSTKDFRTFYPNTVLETGYDILFFWVARMVMLGAEFTGKSPFETVYLHGLVRDERGRKMSKSLNNGIDPLEMIEKYGTDALRLSLVVGSTPGTDLKFSETKVTGQRNFVNKLWNASRYVFGVLGKNPTIAANPTPRGLPDRWILSKLNRLILETNAAFTKYSFGEAAGKIQDFVWNDFCDWYLEITKEAPNKKLLGHVLAQILRLAHPFIPFATEKLWENFFPKAKKPKLLALEKFPRPVKSRISERVEEEMKVVTAIITSIRSVRNELNVEPARKIAAIVYVGKFESFIKKQAGEIKKLARLSSLVVKKSGKKVENAVAKFEAGLEIYLPLSKLLDPKVEKKRLNADLKEAQNYLAVVEKKLANDDFTARAPKNVVEAERAKLASVQEKITKIEERIKVLG
ncbi:MAG: valine--tRNA ligase [Candidatus Peribacteraceae bacterium]|nr:valine--tRNA ligase [Candidatus Peribacteraceae bacterium]